MNGAACANERESVMVIQHKNPGADSMERWTTAELRAVVTALRSRAGQRGRPAPDLRREILRIERVLATRRTESPHPLRRSRDDS